jgi:putative ABC transport system permease protein
VVATPAFAEAHARDTCATGVAVVARYADGAGPSDAEMTAALRSAVPGGAGLLATSIDTEFLDTVRSAVDVAVIALVAFALVTAAAGSLALVQAVIRQAAGADDDALGAMGLTRSQRAAAVALPITAAGAVGSLVGAAGAIALSRVFPLGVARQAEPDPGVQLDGFVLALGVLVLVAVVGSTGYLVARRNAGRVGARERASLVPTTAARLGVGPSVVVGLRLASDRGRGRAVVRTATVGAILAVAGICAVSVLGRSLTGVLERPDRYGWVWTSRPDVEGEDPEALAMAAAEEDGVQAAARLIDAAVEVDGDGADGFALEPLSGTMDFHLLDGRLPSASDEVVLGRAIAEDAALGDTVTVSGSGSPAELTLVGRAILPQFDRQSGISAFMTADALTEVAPDAENHLVLRYAPDADVDELEARLAEEAGLSFPTYSRPHPPGRLTHLDELRGLFVALAAFFGLLGLGGLIHALVVSSRRHRRLFATLRAMGLRRAQVVTSVLICSLAIVIASLLVGVPLGIVIGRTAWRWAVEGLGILDAPWVSAPDVGAIVAAAIAVAIGAGLLPAWRAGRQRPAQVLRSE